MVLLDVLQINVSVKQRCVMNICQASDIKHRRLCASNLLFDRLICNEHSALIILNWATGATRHCADCKIQQIRRKYQHLNIRGLDSFCKVLARIQRKLPDWVFTVICHNNEPIRAEECTCAAPVCGPETQSPSSSIQSGGHVRKTAYIHSVSVMTRQ